MGLGGATLNKQNREKSQQNFFLYETRVLTLSLLASIMSQNIRRF